MAGKSKILVIAATGYIGKFIVEASAKSGHPTFALVRESTVSTPANARIIESFKSHGVTLVFGDLYDHESLVKAIKQVDVVISAVGPTKLEDQVKIIAAIKEAGNVKKKKNYTSTSSLSLDIFLQRFFPSEFGNDADHNHAIGPAKTTLTIKAQFRRTIEAEGIPSYVVSNCFSGYYIASLSQPGATAPPRDKVVILGDGNPKAIFNLEDDIATYTIKAVDDPRTMNKILYIRSPGNIYSFNDLVSLWEKKIGKTLERIYVPDEQILKNIHDLVPLWEKNIGKTLEKIYIPEEQAVKNMQESTVPITEFLSFCHSVFVRGDQTNFEIEPSFGVEASELYPDVKYTTVDEYFNQFV